MATGSGPDSTVGGVYESYVGRPRARPEVYGYWVLAVGFLAVLGGLAAALAGAATDALPPTRARELTIALVGVGGVGVLLGAVLQVPLRRRAVRVAGLGAAISLLAVGGFLSLPPGDWGIESSAAIAVAGAYAGGLGLVALVAALAPVVTGRRCLLLSEESAPEPVWRDSGDDEGETSAVLRGEAERDGVFAVFEDDDAWRWWFVEQTPVADGHGEYESAEAAEASLATVREAVASAGLLELTTAAFRLYDDDGGVRWRLLDRDGRSLARSDGGHDDRAAARAAVNLLKEHGPGAAVLDVEDGAFEVFGTDDEWRWRLVDADRVVRGTSPTEYADRGTARSQVFEVREHARSAPLMDVEHVGFELVEDGGEWHWVLVDDADERLARSAERFPTRDAVTESVHRLAESAVEMPFLTAGRPAYEVVAGEDGGWRWRLVDGDDEVVARSESAVPSEESGRSVVGRVKDVVADGEVLALDDAEFEVYPEGDRWAWRLVTEDRHVVARSPTGRSFETAAAAEDAVASVREEVGTARRIEFDSAAFHVYEAADGTWNWRLVDDDGTVVSDSGQQHASKADATAAMNTMQQHAPDADLVEIEQAAMECYESDGEWHWRLVDDAGATLATSSGREETVEEARTAMDTLELLAPEAEVRRMDAAVFQVYVSDEEPRQWRFRLVHPDGTVVATSTGGFPDEETATAAAQAVAGFSADAAVHTIRDLAVRFSVEDGDDEDGETWRWQVVDRDREVVAGGESTYGSRDAVAERARLLRDHAGAASVFEVDPGAFRLDADANGWRWRLVDADRNTLAVGERGHETREKARANLARVRDLAADADLLDFDRAAFETVETEGEWHWRYVDTAGRTLATGDRTFETRQGVETALETLRETLPEASLLEMESPAFELHEQSDEWRWRLVDADGSTVVEGVRTYESRAGAREALSSLREYGGDAATELMA